MAPLRGNRKRKGAEPSNPPAAASGSSQEDTQEWWDVLSKRIPGLISQAKGMDDFASVFKLSRRTFAYICSLVRDRMTAKPTKFVFSDGHPVTFYDQVAIALRRLSSGDSLIALSESFGTKHSTVSQSTWRFVEAMEENALHHLRWPSTDGEITAIKSKFENLRGLPNCCGAIDTTHITMQVPSSDPSSKMWVDREKNHSMLVQVIVDPAMRFRDVVSGWPGKMTNSSVLQNSSFFNLCENGKRLNGESRHFREYIVGDSAFPLLPWLMTPYKGKLSEAEDEFNRRLFGMRIVAGTALMRLKDTWRIIQGFMWRPDKHKLPRVILVCCILHNIIIDMEDKNVVGGLPLSHNHDPKYEEEVCEFADESAVVMRDKLSLYLSGNLKV